MGPFYSCGKGEQQQVSGYHPTKYYGAMKVTLGKHFKGPLFPLTQGQIDRSMNLFAYNQVSRKRWEEINVRETKIPETKVLFDGKQ